MTEPLVDVLLPVFNAARTIGAAVSSLQRQTVSDIRIIVVDDGSTDSTPAILAEMARTDPRIEVLTVPNGGIVDALNHGLRVCRAKYLARHDGDDIAYPERFATQIAFLEAHPECVAVGSAARHVDEDGRDLHHTALPPQPERSNPFWAPALEPYIIHPFLMTRLDKVQAVGGYRYVFHAEDTDLYWRLQELGTLYNLPDVLGDYRMHGASISSASVRNARVAALNSQLSGLSAIRRRNREPDLRFDRDALAELNAAEQLEPIYALGCRQLSADEARQLRVRLAAKLLDLCTFRPVELELADCRFIRAAVRAELPTLTPPNQVALKRMCNGAAARLASGAGRDRAMALVWPALYPGAVGRLLFRSAMPNRTRRTLLRTLKRAGHYK